MNVSVVICAYTIDRWDDLCTAVRSSIDQSVKAREIIVVIDHNVELFERAQLGLTGVQVLSNRSTKGLSGARNTGVAGSSGDLIVFLDDDAFADHNWLEKLTGPFSDPRVAGVGGWILPNWPSQAPQWFPETFYWVLGCSYDGLPQDNGEIRNPIGANMAVRRRVFDAVGGFTSTLGRIGRNPLAGEEAELCIRYSAKMPGEHFVLSRSAIVHHRVPEWRLTWHYFWTRCWAEGISKAGVASLVGVSSGLAAERRHVMKPLPREMGRCLRTLPRTPRASLTRFSLILMGTALAVAGVLRGKASMRRRPLVAESGSLEKLKELMREEPEIWSPEPPQGT